MSNVNRVRGLCAAKHLNGSAYTGQVQYYHIPSSEANNIFPGDPVKLLGTADANGVPDVGLAGATDVVVGVVEGLHYDPTNLNRIYRPASTDSYAFVSDASDVIYEVQANAVVNTNQVGLNANIVNGGGNTTTGMSGVQLDASTLATTNTLGLQLVGFVQSPDNDVTSTNAKVLVRVNRHQYSNQVAGV